MRPFSWKVNLTENHLFGCNLPLKHPFGLKLSQIVHHGVTQHPAKDFSKIFIFWIFKAKFVKIGQNGPEKTCFSSSFLVLHQISNQSYLYVFLVIRGMVFEFLLGFLKCWTFLLITSLLKISKSDGSVRHVCLPSVTFSFPVELSHIEVRAEFW